jgi:hypothetical protein
MGADETPVVFLIGDAGVDRLVANDREVEVPAGALYLSVVLNEVFGDAPTVETLVGVVSKPRATSTVCAALPPKRAELKKYGEVWRVARYAHDAEQAKASQRTRSGRKKDGGSDPQPVSILEFRGPKAQLDRHSLLVAHNAGSSWDEVQAKASMVFVRKYLDKLPPDDEAPYLPQILVNVSENMPQPRVVPERRDAGGLIHLESELWDSLLKHRDRVGIVTSLTVLRQAGAFVTRRLSWEQGVEDLAAELFLFPPLRALCQFRHLFIRIGMVGFVHVERKEDVHTNSLLHGRVYFCPYAEKGVHRDQESEGGTIGRSSLFIASLVGEMLNGKDDHESIHRAVARSLAAMRLVDDRGYDDAMLRDANCKGEALIAALVKHAKGAIVGDYRVPQPGSSEVLACKVIPPYLLNAPLPNALRAGKKWFMLDEALIEAPVHRINIAMAIVKIGQAKVFNRRWPGPGANGSSRGSGPDREVWDLLTRVEYWNPKDHAPDYVTLHPGNRPALPEWPDRGPRTPAIIGTDETFELCVPMTRFGKLTLLERDEIETLRGIHNLLNLYRTQVRRTTAARPISIAVFGPPGSGKSFAVKQIASSLGEDGTIPQLEFNVSQFRGLDDLSEAFDHIVKVRTNKNVTPLAFFDEFDCVWEGRELGWLKYFLAPMQDGKFQNKDASIGPAIFVFAGGVHASFQRFDPTTDSAYDNLRDSEEYKRRLKGFVDQKGPDFISRLRGHINVSEINDAPGRSKHFIRRAVQLRSLLDQNDRIGKDGIARIDNAIVYALLTVDRYRHGVRSMQAIVEMCSPIYERIDIASLPSRAQLNMHVDAEEFLIRVYRGRRRAQPDWNPPGSLAA